MEKDRLDRPTIGIAYTQLVNRCRKEGVDPDYIDKTLTLGENEKRLFGDNSKAPRLDPYQVLVEENRRLRSLLDKKTVSFLKLENRYLKLLKRG